MSATPVSRRAILASGLFLALGAVPAVGRAAAKPLVTVYKEPT